MTSAHTIDAIRDAVNLPDLAREYGVDLKRAPGGLVAQCPFHSEKTPSFRINTAGSRNGTFKCFGCQAGGDAFGFIMRIENVQFPKALEILSDRTGIEIDGRPRSRVVNFVDREDRAMYNWWWARQVKLAEDSMYAALDEADAVSAPADGYQFAACCGRIRKWILAIAREDRLDMFRCLVVEDDRREYRAEISFERDCQAAWENLRREVAS